MAELSLNTALTQKAAKVSSAAVTQRHTDTPTTAAPPYIKMYSHLHAVNYIRKTQPQPPDGVSPCSAVTLSPDSTSGGAVMGVG